MANQQKRHITNKADVYHIDDKWSLDISDLKDHGEENNRGKRCVLVVIDNLVNLDGVFL